MEKREGKTLRAGAEAEGEERGEKRCGFGGIQASVTFTSFY